MIRIFAPPVLLLLVTTVCHGQVFDEQFDHWPLHTSIGGTVALATELSDPVILTPLLSAPKSRGSRVVLLVGSGESQFIDPVKRSFTGPSLTTLNVAWEDTQSTFHPDSTADILIVFADSLSARERQSNSESWRDLRRFVRQGGVLILLGQSAAELVSDRNADLRSADGVKAAANPGFWPDCVVRSAMLRRRQ